MYEAKNGLSQAKIEERIVFSFVFIGVLALTYGFFFVIDFLPEKPAQRTTAEAIVVAVKEPSETVRSEEVSIDPNAETQETHIDVGSFSGTPQTVSSQDTSLNVDALPVKIIFDALDERVVPVLNPASRSVEALDTALLSGVVRHPDSADFERVGTILLFGHSSYLPSVINKNFQAFNGIQKMTWGDIIRLQSSDTEYVYRVDRVYEVSANDAEIEIAAGEAKLTLVTCDSFGAKTDRFVVEATLVRQNTL